MTPEELKRAAEDIQMDEGMYDRILTTRKPRRDKVLAVTGTMCAMILLAVLVLVGVSLRNQLRFWNFVGNLSDGITYAYENDCLRAEVDGTQIRVSGKNMYKVYNYIVQGKAGREQRQVPQEPCGASLDFGNGATLRLWAVDAKDRDGKNLLLCFQDPEGDTYIYTTSKLLLETFTTNYLYPGNNQLCEE